MEKRCKARKITNSHGLRNSRMHKILDVTVREESLVNRTFALSMKIKAVQLQILSQKILAMQLAHEAESAQSRKRFKI